VDLVGNGCGETGREIGGETGEEADGDRRAGIMGVDGLMPPVIPSSYLTWGLCN